MPTIDVQVHCYERNHPGRPWHAVLAGPPEVTAADMLKAMDSVGVVGALLVSVHTMYHWDASCTRVAVQKAHPDKFAVIKPVDPNDPKVEGTIAEWAAMDGTVAIRIMMNDSVSTDAGDPGINRVLAAAARHDLPVNLMARELEQVGQMAARNPNTQLVIDHLGLEQPMKPPPPAHPWHELPKLLALAPHRNIVVKISGACTLSHEKFPYKDIWDPLGRIFDTFSLDRCM